MRDDNIFQCKSVVKSPLVVVGRGLSYGVAQKAFTSLKQLIVIGIRPVYRAHEIQGWIPTTLHITDDAVKVVAQARRYGVFI